MPLDKPNIPYKTLDVLLLYLLGYTEKAIRVRKEVFLAHSAWFRLQRLRCVRIQEETDKNDQQWIVLTRCKQRALQNHLSRFFILYFKGTVPTASQKPSWKEWVVFLRKMFLVRLQGCKQVGFAFSGKESMLPYGSDACAFAYMCKSVSALVNHETEDVQGVTFDAKNNCAYVIYKTSYKQGKQLLMARFGTLICGWRTRPGVRWAFYKEHYVQFHSATNKQKRLLDLLLETNLRVSVLSAAQCLQIKASTKEDKRACLYDIGRELRNKAIRACKGTKDKVTFEISVAGDYVQMVESISS